MRFFKIAFGFFMVASAVSAQKVKDFRGTNQKLALMGCSSEFMEPAPVTRITAELRKELNKYTRSYGDSSISNFSLSTNPNNQFYSAVEQEFGEPQKKFLQEAAKNNGINIISLCSLRATGDGMEAELQLFDARTETLSGNERVAFTAATQSTALADLAYRMMNYLDRDGFVNKQAQDFLEKPQILNETPTAAPSGQDDFSVNPNQLGSGQLAGETTVGGEKTPFWETWWFWGLIGGGLATAGGLSYYFLVVDQPPDNANVKFQFP